METAVDYTSFKLSDLAPDEKEEGYGEMHLVNSGDVQREMMMLLEDAESHWMNLEDVRRRRRRNREFYRGRQWSDELTDPEDGKRKTEEAYLLKNGKQPLVNNQLRQLVKNLLGQFRDNDYKPQARSRKREDASISEMMTNAIQYVYDCNELKELDVREFEEFLLSGVVCWKSGFDWMKERDTNEVMEDVVNPNYLFWNTETRDIRGKDINMIGEMIDAPLEEIISAFAKTDEEEKVIRQWYHGYESRRVDYLYRQGSEREDALDFRYPNDVHLCRYYEIWKLKYKKKVICHDYLNGRWYQHPMDIEQAIAQVEQENNQRLEDAYMQYASQGFLYESFDAFVMSEDGMNVPIIEYQIKRNEPVWCFYMITPEGYVLDSGETPYEHQEHPYTLRLFPLIDGEVWGFMEDVIDQQKMINRMVTLVDWVITYGAKGVLMIPETSLPEGMTPEDFSSQYQRHNGLIVYKPDATGSKPEMVYNQSLPAGAIELLQIELNLLKEISGVTPAMQGQEPKSGTPASLYAQQANNAAISSKDYFEHFFSARRKRDYKILKLIKQFYQEERFINVAGMDYESEAAMYKPELVQDVEFDLVIGKSANAPVYRMMIDEFLMKFLEAQAIDLPMFLENTSLPFADKLLQQIKEKQEALQQQMAMTGQDPAAAQMIQQTIGQKAA